MPLVRVKDMKPLVLPSTVGGPDAIKLAPCVRAATKGTDACMAIISSLLSGTSINGDDKLYIVDLNPSLSGDWPGAAWTMMKKKMTEGCAWPHMACHSSCTDGETQSALVCNFERLLVTEWWLPRPESGPSEPVQDFDSARPTLKLASWNNQSTTAGLPNVVRDKFEKSSQYFDSWMNLVEDFDRCCDANSLIAALGGGDVGSTSGAGNVTLAGNAGLKVDGPDFSVIPVPFIFKGIELGSVPAAEWDPTQVHMP